MPWPRVSGLRTRLSEADGPRAVLLLFGTGDEDERAEV